MQHALPVAAADQGPSEIHILFGTQTGTTEMVASDIEDALVDKGFPVPAPRGLDEVEPRDLATLGTVLIVCSSYGDGGFPDAAAPFYEALTGPDAPDLSGVDFAVLGFGDSSYDDFCAAGRKLDEALAARGAARLHPRGSCDIVYETEAQAWTDGVLAVLEARRGQAPQPVAAPARPARSQDDRPARPQWTRANPFSARLIENERLSGPDSDKDMRHFRIDLGPEGPAYTAGDALNVLPENDPDLIAGWLARTTASPDAPLPGHDRAFAEMLRDGLEISRPSRDLIALVAQRSGDAELARLLVNGDREALDAWLWDKDALDLLSLAPDLRLTAEEAATVLRPLQHRSYSIASSAKVAPQTVDLTVSVVRYHSHGRRHGGVCSTFLADRLRPGQTVRVFVSPNTAFRVPADPSVPMIMVGPGAGIAPFLGFLEERAALGADGMNWLIFGDRTQAQDFIYRERLARWQKDGLLTRLDLAFSRDQASKVYVQDRLRDAGADLFAALEQGGHVYVCGDALRMAPDVDDALHAIVRDHGGLDEDGARDYVARLRKEKRYLRDVY